MRRVSAPSPFAPGRLGDLALRNRLIKTATFEGMSPGGVPSEALARHHRAIAAGGVGMTTVAYCAVSPAGRTFADQMWLRPEIVPALRRLTDSVHAEGAAASLQLGHCGFFTRSRAPGSRGARGPSFGLNVYGLAAGLPFARAMGEGEIREVIEDFGRAASLAREAGFDAVELHLGHGYLLSQFLSPATNRRRDAWGGDLEGRLRLPLAVLRRVREQLGPGFPILAKTNLRDGFRGGLEVAESVEIGRALEREGADAIVPSGGFTSRNAFYMLRGGVPIQGMAEVEESRAMRLAIRLFGPLRIRAVPFEELFFLPEARALRAAVRLPLVLLGGARSLDAVERALGEGFDFVALGRALIADPDLPARWARGERARSRCTSCNECVVEMDRGGVRCVLDGPRPA